METSEWNGCLQELGTAMPTSSSSAADRVSPGRSGIGCHVHDVSAETRICPQEAQEHPGHGRGERSRSVLGC